MLRKLLLGAWYIFFVVLMLLAFTISIARGYPSLYQKYLPVIQENISTLVGKPVHADSIRIDWYGITPFISTNNLSIYEDETQYDLLLNAEKATISLDLYKSLLQKKVVFKELTLIDSNLDLLRTADEKIILNGIDISERLSQRKKLEQKNKLIINLLDSTISIEDELKELNFFFDRVDISLGFSDENFNIKSEFILPETLGRSLTIVADIRDLDKGLKNIKGELYANGNNINLELINDFFPKSNLGVKKGNSDFQIWGDFSSLKQRTLSGKFSLRDLVYSEVDIPLLPTLINKEIIAVDTFFQFSGDMNNWKLALNEVNIQTTDHAWPGKQYEISCRSCEEQSYILAAALDYVNSDQLLCTLQHFPFIAERLNQVLSKIELHGELQDIKVLAEFGEKKITKYQYQASLLGANFSIPEYEFSASEVTGDVIGDHSAGEINFATQSTAIALNHLLNNPLENQNITGVIKWKLRKNDKLFALQKLNIESNDMSVDLQGLAHIIDGKPHVDIQLSIPEADVTEVKKYLPYKRMHPKLSKWLNESISSGIIKNGKLLIQGNPKNFPFKNKRGRFQVSAEIEKGVLDYRKNWPSAKDIVANFEINNDHLVLNATHGSILDSSLSHVHAEIADLKLPLLVINGTAAGPSNNILEYLQQSSLLSENSQVIKQISANGTSELNLNIKLTLTRKLEKQLLVSGEIEFKDTNISVKALSLPFTHVNGKLKFDQNGAQGKDLKAKLYGAPILASAEKLSEGRTKLLISGDLDLDSYLFENYRDLNKYLKGITDVSAEINIPKLDKNSSDKSLKVAVTSDLYGAQILLPEPFRKEPNDSRQLVIHSKHQQGENSEVFANLNSQYFMKAIFGKESGKLSAMNVHMGNEQFIMPESGIKISGRLKHVNLNQWRDIISSNEEKNVEVNEIDLYVNQMKLGNIEIDNVDFHTRKKEKFWIGEIHSSVAKGGFEYPVDSESGSVATFDFDYLRFPSANNESEDEATSFDPRSLPALVANTKEFKYKDAAFTDVSLKTKPSEHGLTIDSLQGSGNDLHVSSNGAWNIEDDNSHITQLLITLQTDNIQNSLTGLGFDSAVTGGRGRVTADFRWPKAPYQFSLASVSGNVNIRLNDGAISSVEPGGAGRLIGLVNLGEISRRLSLDFTDFFSKGYSFEKIRGDLQFKDANLTTENLKVKGPSADILIQGRTGITAKDYDQIVTVTPHVSGGLPWIGLAVGGPLGAVGVIVGEKIAKTIGVDVDKVTEVKYSMTGSWEDPKLEPIARKVAENSTNNQGQLSPNSTSQNSPQVSPQAPQSESKESSDTATP